MNKPQIQIYLEGLHAFVEVVSESYAEEFDQYGFVKTLNKTVGLWRFDLGSAVLNVVEGQIQFKRMDKTTSHTAV